MIIDKEIGFFDIHEDRLYTSSRSIESRAFRFREVPCRFSFLRISGTYFVISRDI